MITFSCRAPIASLDCMEEFTGTNEHLTMHATATTTMTTSTTTSTSTTMGVPGTKEALLLSNFHYQNSINSGTNPISTRQGTVTPGLRYRNLGKSGLRVSNVGLGNVQFIFFFFKLKF